MHEKKSTGPLKAILAGCGAALLVWSAFLYFFTAKDNPYELGWLFMLLGFTGMGIASALSGPVVAGTVRGRGARDLTAPDILMLACPFMPLLGWSAALGMHYTDATPGSAFMAWALTLGISGFLAPPVTAGLVRMQKKTALSPGRTDGGTAAKPPSRRFVAYAAAGVPGLVAAALFALTGDFYNDRFFSMLFVMIGVTSAPALPSLIAVIARLRKTTGKLILGLALWLVAATLLLGSLMGVYILWEIIHGIMHFRL